MFTTEKFTIFPPPRSPVLWVFLFLSIHSQMASMSPNHLLSLFPISIKFYAFIFKSRLPQCHPCLPSFGLIPQMWNLIKPDSCLQIPVDIWGYRWRSHWSVSLKWSVIYSFNTKTNLIINYIPPWGICCWLRYL